MINHVRSLLLNAPAGGHAPGEEYVPPDYQPARLPSELEAVRRVLFGADPDRLMRNYRVAQFLAVLHASPLAPYLTAADPRVAYEPGRSPAFTAPGAFAPAVLKAAAGAGEELVVTPGDGEPPDASGRAAHAFAVAVRPGGLAVSAASPPRDYDFDVAWSGNLSAPVTLPGTGLTFRVTTARPGASWQVDVALRPARTPGDLLADVDALGGPVALALFGAVPAEPYLTFRNAYAARETPLRIAGLLLALAWRTDERRSPGA